MDSQKEFTNYWYVACLNGILAVILGIGYFFSRSCNPRQFFFIPNDPTTITFLASTHFSSIMLLTLIIGLMLSPSILLPKKIGKHILSITWSIFITWFFLDVLSNYFFSVGINTTLTMLHLFNLPSEHALEFKIIFSLLVIFLYFFQYSKFKNLAQPLTTTKKKILYLLLVAIIILTIISYSIFNLGFNKSRQQFIASSKSAPWFYQNNEFMQKIPSVNQNTLAQNMKNILIGKQPKVKYPLKPLITEEFTQPPNIVMIIIDCWRADFFNSADTPKLWNFAQTGKIFYNHNSSGNCTKFGLFGLFYGLPATHMDEFKRTKQTPVFIDRLKQLNYQIRAFTWCAKEADQTNVYYYLHNTEDVPYYSKGYSHAQWDKNLTADWLKWHQGLDKTKAYFSLVLYGSAYGNDFEQSYTKNYPPTKGEYRYKDLATKLGKDAFIETYRTAVNYIDNLASSIIDRLETSGDLANTVVIITGDHGQEFAENSQSFWGHGTNFTSSQTKTPFSIVGPKFTNNTCAMQSEDLTCHYDVVPTMMKNFLGVRNDTNDYSTGIDLLNKRVKRDWSIIVGNFKWCGIINKDFITYCHASGNYCNTSKKNHPLFNQKVNPNRLNQALEQMFKFLQ